MRYKPGHKEPERRELLKISVGLIEKGSLAATGGGCVDAGGRRDQRHVLHMTLRASAIPDEAMQRTVIGASTSC
ncbi:hypothetical protein [Noviherbaspirillum sp. Root189]|uniref:hypothetical protein n=1 Tax=Noviherbaspirillum sp. Root189 TaxID=1736487 RepID=UPI00070F06A7|nr:hypothetical protein [Noviherbaspirillum sp. Root189]KRB83874.1 hypothetical protein ASE07_23420 [Noviherbaspirillum sp. Root189]